MTGVAPAARAVVFAYHDVGVRCLRTLLEQGIEVPLVLTHLDAPGEQIWFDSVARHAEWHGIETLAPPDPNVPEIVERVRAARPDFVFSFYYRAMLQPALLSLPSRGAYNMHGSLLPKYRGRVPINWAILHGETETGATLHAMAAKADAGAIIDQQAVPILLDDIALEVFRKVVTAAELVLHRSLPALLRGTAPHRPQDLSAGSYFGGRSARDGGIDWRRGARPAHNLIRAVAPPYPGAFSELEGEPLRILRSLPVAMPDGLAAGSAPVPALRWHAGALYALCGDGALKILEFELGAQRGSAVSFHRRFGDRAVALRAFME